MPVGAVWRADSAGNYLRASPASCYKVVCQDFKDEIVVAESSLKRGVATLLTNMAGPAAAGGRGGVPRRAEPRAPRG